MTAKNKPSFWSTTAGVVTVVTGLLTAVAGLLTVTVQAGWIGPQGDERPGPGTPKPAETTSVSANEPLYKHRDPGSTVTINGVTYTCESLTDIRPSCSSREQIVFDTFKGNFTAFLSSDRLGPFNEGSLDQKAYLGLIACVVARAEGRTEPTQFVDLVMRNPDIRNWVRGEGTAVLPVWFEAQQILCPV